MMNREEPSGVPNRTTPIVLHSSNGSPGGIWNSSMSFTTGMITTLTHTHTPIDDSNMGTDIGMWSVAPALSVPPPLSTSPLSSTQLPPPSLVRPGPLSPTRPLSLASRPALRSSTRPASLTGPAPSSPARHLSLARPIPLSPPRPLLSLVRPSPLAPTRPLARLARISRPRPLSLTRPPPPHSLVRSRRPPSLATPPPYTDRVHNAHIPNRPFPLPSIRRDENGVSTWTRHDEQGYREPVNVVQPSTSVVPSPPPLLDNGIVSYVPDTLNATYDRDFLYAMQLQMEEYQGHKEEQMPMMMMDIVDHLPMSTPRLGYNLHHPRPPETMTNVVAGPSSRPLTTLPITAVATGTTTVLDLTCECTGCFDTFKSFEGLQSSCGHYFCLPCVRIMVTASVSDESLFPPKCCKQPLMATFAEQMAEGGGTLLENKGKHKHKVDDDKGFMQIKWLGLILDDNMLKEQMERRWHEWGVKGEERVYCSNASCAIFLGSATELGVGRPGDNENYFSHLASANTTRSGNHPQTANLHHLFHSKKSSSSSSLSMDAAGTLPMARCAACATLTCVSCRGRAHAGQTCTDSKDVAFWKMVKMKRWRQCPACGAVIEKNGGCSHMACRCGNSFTMLIH